MSRPNPRLLVPVSALPVLSGGRVLAPEGARVWIGSQSITVNQRGDGVAPHDMLDASAPELHDGLPVRLDALPWLLKALHPDAARIESVGSHAFMVMDSKGRGIVTISTYDPGWCAGIVLDPWPDLTGLSPDDAARAVVVAAIVARGGAK